MIYSSIDGLKNLYAHNPEAPELEIAHLTALKDNKEAPILLTLACGAKFFVKMQPSTTTAKAYEFILVRMD